MQSNGLGWRRTWSAVAVAALVLASSLVVQASGPNQAAHFALVRALADGTAEIDPGETIDAAYVDGRFYAAKAPGLAMFTLPWYRALRAVGLQDAPLSTAEGYTRRLWELNLAGAILPALALLLLMAFAGNRVAPGLGVPAAVLLGAGTLLLPFATLFFDHALSAAFGFVAFVVLFIGRNRRRGALVSATAGLLGGLAIVTEFPLALVTVVLAGYAASGSDGPRRLVAYAAGALLGVAPLLAYNTWALGSPTRLSYTNALVAPVGPGEPVVGANDEGFYGVGLPEPDAILSLVFSAKGLAVVTPLALFAVAGLPLLWRAGWRAEAVVCGVVPLAFLAYNAAYYLPWGGQAPGPRFLVPALPFLALPLALLLRARPVAVGAVGLVSVAVVALGTLTDPLTGEEHGIETWWDRLERGALVDTVVGRLGVDDPWATVAPVILLLVLACALVLAALPRAGWRAELPLAVALLASWLIVASIGPNLRPASAGTLAGTLAVALLAVALIASILLAARCGWPALVAVLPLLVLVMPAFDDRPRVALLWLLGACAVVATVWVWREPTRDGGDSPTD